MKRLDLFELGSLTFEAPDVGRFPCINLAYRAGREGGLVPGVLNVANEVANERFRKNEIGFKDVAAFIERALDDFSGNGRVTMENILETDRVTREKVRNF